MQMSMATQVGFLGICGEKHPVLQGLNKIGRDPQKCSIVLNLDSVSRQHAVINVLNDGEFMLMDLESANKTKVQNKGLQPYVPYPLKNGDTVQFGNIFGIFRLLEEEDDELPMTQDLGLPLTQPLDRPETPLRSKAVISESPDVRGVRNYVSANRVQSDCSTDCKDIDRYHIDMASTQKIPEIIVNADNDVTVCEDNVLPVNKPVVTGDHTKFNDVPTQILDEYHAEKSANDNVDIEEQPNQIVEEIVPQKPKETSLSKFQKSFKVPVESPTDTTVTSKPGTSTSNESNEDNYYQATQEIYDDLCSEREMSPDNLQVSTLAKKHDDALTKLQKSFTRAADVKGANLNKVPSDSSDEESTPKKLLPFLYNDSDLPSDQEITIMMKQSVSTVAEQLYNDSESENSEDHTTPIVHHKKKTKRATKIDFSNKSNIRKLPEKIMSRQRKPTEKFGDSTDKHVSSKILKSWYLPDDEDQVDSEIISKNIKRLKAFEKAKSSRDSFKNDVRPKEDEKEKSSRSRGCKGRESKGIEDRIEKSKKKETKAKSGSPPKAVEKKSGRDNDLRVFPKTRSRRNRAERNETETQENTSKITSILPYLVNKKETENRTSGRRKQRSTAKEKSLAEQLKEASTNARKPTYQPYVPCDRFIAKDVREQSIMESSSTKSNKSLKRSLVEDSEVPSPKRTRSYIKNSSSTSSGINNSSLRATPARLNKTHKVLLIDMPNPVVQQKLKKLGAVIVTDVMQCSVVLTMHIKRTFKLLCALGLGKPIVGPGWVQACNDTNSIVDPWKHLLNDESAEKSFGFSLRQSLTGKRDFLKGYSVSSTPSVLPDATEMERIVSCSGGSWREGRLPWVCVSCPKDKALWPDLRWRGATIVSTDFILCGALKQKRDFSSYTFASNASTVTRRRLSRLRSVR
ncbi:unnamed protein product [Chrysodeixis includens]|uniref:Mediator of DNA damage checkpoint protein 1 n=1 Tax=Chrysodeixis includens TaxID=689277 RepID=A0A9P0C0D7_CHRIL|nr:unnamed protein product [Chrysodeixis includens]